MCADLIECFTSSDQVIEYQCGGMMGERSADKLYKIELEERRLEDNPATILKFEIQPRSPNATFICKSLHFTEQTFEGDRVPAFCPRIQ